jgi:hypothetical protein
MSVTQRQCEQNNYTYNMTPSYKGTCLLCSFNDETCQVALKNAFILACVHCQRMWRWGWWRRHTRPTAPIVIRVCFASNAPLMETLQLMIIPVGLKALFLQMARLIQMAHI